MDIDSAGLLEKLRKRVERSKKKKVGLAVSAGVWDEFVAVVRSQGFHANDVAEELMRTFLENSRKTTGKR